MKEGGHGCDGCRVDLAAGLWQQLPKLLLQMWGSWEVAAYFLADVAAASRGGSNLGGSSRQSLCHCGFRPLSAAAGAWLLCGWVLLPVCSHNSPATDLQVLLRCIVLRRAVGLGGSSRQSIAAMVAAASSPSSPGAWLLCVWVALPVSSHDRQATDLHGVVLGRCLGRGIGAGTGVDEQAGALLRSDSAAGWLLPAG